jgi:hypothetical protein
MTMLPPNFTAEAGAARLWSAGRAGCFIASVMASRRLVRQAKPGEGGSK